MSPFAARRGDKSVTQPLAKLLRYDHHHNHQMLSEHSAVKNSEVRTTDCDVGKIGALIKVRCHHSSPTRLKHFTYRQITDWPCSTAAINTTQCVT